MQKPCHNFARQANLPEIPTCRGALHPAIAPALLYLLHPCSRNPSYVSALEKPATIKMPAQKPCHDKMPPKKPCQNPLRLF